jgi:hypothetical protein
MYVRNSNNETLGTNLKVYEARSGVGSRAMKRNFQHDGYGGFRLTLSVAISQGDAKSLAGDFNSTLKVASAPTVAGIKALTSYESVFADNQVLATNGLVSASSGATVTVDLFLPAPSSSTSFYKVFALDELPAKE